MDKNFALVATMNNAFANPIGNLSNVDWTKLSKQCKNIADEINELKTGWDERDAYKVRDAICDILVFTYGGFHFMGFAAKDRQHYRGHTLSNHEGPGRSTIFVSLLQAQWSELMAAIDRQSLIDTVCQLNAICIYCADLAKTIRQPLDQDMEAVIGGVMTRFVKDDADKAATVAKHAANGITDVFFVGDYPTMIMKSGSDQPDAPKGKFLKSASFSEPTFVDADINLDAFAVV